MTSPARYALLPLGLALLLAAGCKSGQRSTAQPAPKPADVTAEDIERNPGQPIEEILKGRVAGVTVARAPGGGIAVRIRGGSSLYGNNEPLYVVDGMPIEAGPGGSLTGIDPYDIESIKVLKDPAETAIWGIRGANGVIIIQTKRAPRKVNPSPN
ncbi:MAG TPA: TonB-dependent receptor plug domain-containing protein [Gemmatimonadaceae bacterium]|nr:TonB-dependent receptor plug domain-containing protein [Gemmatimonadaceae bacterium]